MMWKHLERYSFQLINEVPHELYVAMLIVLCVGTLILIGLCGLKKGLSYSLRLMFVEYVFLLYASTVIFRAAMSVSAYDFTPFWSYRAIITGEGVGLQSEIIMNTLVFVPVGVLAGAAFRRMNWKKVMAIGAGLSIGIEVLQYVMKRGLCEVDDVIHNTLGCAIGYGVWLVIRRVAKRRG